MDITNKTLALFLLAAVVVSLGGTLMNLSQLSDLSPTGLATDTGEVDIEITGTVSITTEDSDAIDFGQCSPLAGEEAVVNSEGDGADQIQCDGINDTDSSQAIAVRNNGNINALVEVSTDMVGAAQGGDFLDSTSGNSSIAIRSVNDGAEGNSGGCIGTTLDSYETFTDTGLDDEKTVCSELGFGGSTNSILAHIEIVIPFDAPTGQETFTLTFEGSQA